MRLWPGSLSWSKPWGRVTLRASRWFEGRECWYHRQILPDLSNSHALCQHSTSPSLQLRSLIGTAHDSVPFSSTTAMAQRSMQWTQAYQGAGMASISRLTRLCSDAVRPASPSRRARCLMTGRGRSQECSAAIGQKGAVASFILLAISGRYYGLRLSRRTIIIGQACQEMVRYVARLSLGYQITSCRPLRHQCLGILPWRETTWLDSWCWTE
jgi:hypothetical protein